MHPIEQRLTEAGIILPNAAAPAANYAPRLIANGVLYVSGQLPMQDGKPSFIGKLGDDTDVETGQQAARQCAINILAQVKAELGGDWSRLQRCIRLGGFVNATSDFTQHPAVINGASDLIAQILGEIGTHSRAAVGVASLPFGVAVEVDAMFAVST